MVCEGGEAETFWLAGQYITGLVHKGRHLTTTVGAMGACGLVFGSNNILQMLSSNPDPADISRLASRVTSCLFGTCLLLMQHTICNLELNVDHINCGDSLRILQHSTAHHAALYCAGCCVTSCACLDL